MSRAEGVRRRRCRRRRRYPPATVVAATVVVTGSAAKARGDGEGGGGEAAAAAVRRAAGQHLAECLSADPRLPDPYEAARIIALERPTSLLECITDFDMLAAFVSEVVAEPVDDMKMQEHYARRRSSGSRKEKEKVGAVDAVDAV